jgi:hypothetical protein
LLDQQLQLHSNFILNQQSNCLSFDQRILGLKQQSVLVFSSGLNHLLSFKLILKEMDQEKLNLITYRNLKIHYHFYCLNFRVVTFVVFSKPFIDVIFNELHQFFIF